MLTHVVAAQVFGQHRQRLTFEDGVAGQIDVARLVAFECVLAALADPGHARAIVVGRKRRQIKSRPNCNGARSDLRCAPSRTYATRDISELE